MVRKYVHTKAFQKKVYSPRGLVQNAIISGLTSKKSFYTIQAELAKLKKNVSIASLTEQARQLRKRGISLPKPAVEKQKQMMLAIIKAEETGMSTGVLANQLGISKSTVVELKDFMRKKGIPIKINMRPQKPKVNPIFTAKEAEWVSKNHSTIKRAIKIVCQRKGFSRELSENFYDYVTQNLPRILRRHDPKKGIPLEKFVPLTIIKFISRDFTRISVARMLKITTKETARLFKYLSEVQHGVGAVTASRKSGLTLKRAKELEEMYHDGIRFHNGAISYNELREEK